jgi:hypothetical protein
MTTYDFAATILYGSSSCYGADAAAASAQASGGDGNRGGVGGPPRRRQRSAALAGCILSKINELGEYGASDFKKNMADFCGVSFKGAFEGWARELREKFGLVLGNGDDR